MNYPFFNPYAQQPAINQTFQLNPNGNELEGRYANNIDEVRNVLAIKKTLFINNDNSILWIKDTAGAIKTYELKEIIELDEKDKKINQLEKELNDLKEMFNNANSRNVIENAREQESTTGDANSTSYEYGNATSTTSSTTY